MRIPSSESRKNRFRERAATLPFLLALSVWLAATGFGQRAVPASSLSKAQISRDLAGLKEAIALAADDPLAKALDAVLAEITEAGVSRRSYAASLQAAFGVQGDLRVTLAAPKKELGGDCLPFELHLHDGRFVGLIPERTTSRRRLIDPAHPSIMAMDGRSMAEWLKAAGAEATGGNQAMVSLVACERLRWVSSLRTRLGLAESSSVELTLASSTGSTTTRSVFLSRKPILMAEGAWARLGAVEDADVGYLCAHPDMRNEALRDAIASEWKKKALILDLRGGGWDLEQLSLLFPYFMAYDDPPRVALFGVPASHGVLFAGAGEELLAREGFRAFDDASWSEQAKSRAKTVLGTWSTPLDKVRALVLERRGWDGPPFLGPVAVLHDSRALNSDAVIAAFQGWRKVTTFGTETLGWSRDRISWQLPESGIALLIGMTSSLRSSGAPLRGQGIRPDVVVRPTLADLMGSRDSLLEVALEALHRQLKR